jgi:hypothetical protein
MFQKIMFQKIKLGNIGISKLGFVGSIWAWKIEYYVKASRCAILPLMYVTIVTK